MKIEWYCTEFGEVKEIEINVQDSIASLLNKIYESHKLCECLEGDYESKLNIIIEGNNAKT